MSLLIGSIDEFRDELVHTLRNLLDPLPPPVHIHSCCRSDSFGLWATHQWDTP